MITAPKPAPHTPAGPLILPLAAVPLALARRLSALRLPSLVQCRVVAMCRARSMSTLISSHSLLVSIVRLCFMFKCLLPLDLFPVADETYPVSGCPSVGMTLGPWTAWSASCGYAERTRSVSRCSANYPASYIPAPVGYYDTECYVKCETNQEEDYTNGAACPICKRGFSMDLHFLTIACVCRCCSHLQTVEQLWQQLQL